MMQPEIISKDKIQAEKKLQEARNTLKWMPYFTVVVLGTVVFDCVGFGKHLDLGHLIRFISPVGLLLYCVSHWSESCAVLNGKRSTWQSSIRVAALLMTCAGPSLSDMYHHKEIAFFIAFGLATLTLVVLFLGFSVLEAVGIWQQAQKKQRFTIAPALDE